MARRQTAGEPAKGRAQTARRKLKVVTPPEEVTNPEEVLIERWTEQASTAVLICRQHGHSFPDADLLRLYRLNATYSVRELTCQRCSTKRRDVVVSGTLSVVRRQYEYVQGYQREAGADGSKRLPRWAVTDAFSSRLDYLEPPEHIRTLFDNLRL